jgi:hypothetical protein
MTVHASTRELRDHAAGAPVSPDLESHIGGCPACAGVLEGERRLLQEIDAVLGQARVLEASPSLLVQARSLAALRPPARVRWLRAAGAVAAALVAAVVLVQRGMAPTPRDASTTAAPRIPPEVRTPEAAPVAVSQPECSPARSRPTASVNLPLVPPGQERALVRFAELMQGGTVLVPDHLLHPADLLAEPPDVDRPLLSIAPIEATEAQSEE